jgi:hypothetical protein
LGVFRKKPVVLGFRLLFMPPFFEVDIRDASRFGTTSEARQPPIESDSVAAFSALAAN